MDILHFSMCSSLLVKHWQHAILLHDRLRNIKKQICTLLYDASDLQL